MDDDGFRMDVAQDDAVAVVGLVGELDLAGRDVLEAELARVVDSGIPHLEIDLSQLQFMDSIGTGILVRAWQATVEAGTSMVIRSGSPTVMRALEVAGLDKVLPLEDYEGTSNHTTLPSPGTGSQPQSDASD